MQISKNQNALRKSLSRNSKATKWKRSYDSSSTGKKVEDKQVLDTQLDLTALEDKLVNIISQAPKEEQEYQEVQKYSEQVQVTLARSSQLHKK